MYFPARTTLAWTMGLLLLLACPAGALAATHPYNTGCSRLRSGDLDGAASAFKKALKLNDRDTDSLNNLAVVYIQNGRPKDAEALLRKALRINSRYAGAYANLGASELVREDFRASVTHSQSATKAVRSKEGDKVRAAAYHNLGVVYLQTGKPADAAEAFQQSLAITKDDQSLLGAGVSACSAGDFENGIDLVKQVYDKLEPGTVRVEAQGVLAASYCDKAWSLLEKKDLDEARRVFGEASALRPDAEGALGTYVVDAEEGDYASAADGMRDLADTSPDAEVRQAAGENLARIRSLQDEATAPLKWSALAAGMAAAIAHAFLLMKSVRARTARSGPKTRRIILGVFGAAILLPALFGLAISPDRSVGAVAVLCALEAALLVYMWSLKRVALAW